MTNLLQISLADWDQKLSGYNFEDLPDYVGPLGRFLADGDLRLKSLKFDGSIESLRLWNFLLSEETRLHHARAMGKKIVGTMKDLGTIPVIAYSLPNMIAFYPDGAWWIPCIKQLNQKCLSIADELGIDDSFCPVRAMLGAFVCADHFPVPDCLICSVGACCDDFSAIAQRLCSLGFDIHWWEIPHRRLPDPNENFVQLENGLRVPSSLVNHVVIELKGVIKQLEKISEVELTAEMLCKGIRKANQIRLLINQIRTKVFTAPKIVLPALELLIVEMLAIHFCSDQDQSIAILSDLLKMVELRILNNVGFGNQNAVPVFWVNPVADLRVMNLLEEVGGRICGTDYLFLHALDFIDERNDPIEALAKSVLADRMIGSAQQRAHKICQDIELFGAKALVISRVPGASHCALEGQVIAKCVKAKFNIPVIEIEVPSLIDSCLPSLKTRLEALIEMSNNLT